jgi:hypothetical protein
MKLVRPEDVTPEMLRNLEYKDLTPEELAEVYRLSREMFTAEDLQRFTELPDGDTNAEDFLRELEETQRQFDEKAT